MFLSTLASGVFFVIGVFFFAFFIWRKLKEDYESDQIFTFILVLTSLGILGWWLWEFWASIFALSLIVIYWWGKRGFRMFEIVDAVSPAWFWFSGFLFLANRSQPEAAVSFFSLLVYFILLARYRTFSWYPSGKVGFAGLASLGVFFLANFIVEILFSYVLSFEMNTFDLILSLFSALMLFAVVYLRSGRELAERIVQKR